MWGIEAHGAPGGRAAAKGWRKVSMPHQRKPAAGIALSDRFTAKRGVTAPHLLPRSQERAAALWPSASLQPHKR